MKLSLNCSSFTQLVALLLLFVLPQTGMCQGEDVDAGDIDPCTSADTVDHVKAVDFYLEHNINISAYDWSNTNVNCHIALGYKNAVKEKNFLGAGIATLCVGAVVLGSGMVWGVVEDPEKSLDGSAATSYIGAALCAGGVLLLHLRINPKRESKYHMREVEYYFRE